MGCEPCVDLEAKEVQCCCCYCCYYCHYYYGYHSHNNKMNKEIIPSMISLPHTHTLPPTPMSSGCFHMGAAIAVGTQMIENSLLAMHSTHSSFQKHSSMCNVEICLGGCKVYVNHCNWHFLYTSQHTPSFLKTQTLKLVFFFIFIVIPLS